MKEYCRIIDNFLPKEELNYLRYSILSNNFPWYKTKIVPTAKEFQFTHMFFNEQNGITSKSFNLIEFFIEKLFVKKFIKIKANMLLKTEKIVEHGFHMDIDPLIYPNSKTAVFYCNNNNGYTRFSDETIINSVENRMLIFNSEFLHTGTTCTDEEFRAVINFNYLDNVIK
jgi:hypothetical protein